MKDATPKRGGERSYSLVCLLDLQRGKGAELCCEGREIALPLLPLPLNETMTYLIVLGTVVSITC